MSDTPILNSYEVTKPEGDGNKRLPIDEDVRAAFQEAFDVPSTSEALPELPPQVVLGNPTAADTKPAAVPVGKGARIDVDGTLRPGGDEDWRLKDLYFAARDDGKDGSGTYLDPWDVSTPAKFDQRMTALYESGDAANLYFAAGDYYINPIRPHEVHPVVEGVYAPWYWGNAWFLNGEGMGRTVFHFAEDSNLPGDATGSRILLRSSRKPDDAGFAPGGCIRNITIDGGVASSDSLPGPATTYRWAFDLDVGIFAVENVEFVRLGGRGQEMFPLILGYGMAAADPDNPPRQSITVTGCKSDELHHNGFNGSGFLIRSSNPGHHQRLLAYDNTFKDAYWCGANYWHIDHDAETIDGGRGNYGCYNYDTGSCQHLSFRRLKCTNGGSTQNLAGCITIGNKDPDLNTTANNWRHITIEDCYFQGREGSPMACPAIFIAGGGVDDLKIRNIRIKKVTGQPAYGVIFYDTLLSDTIYYPGHGVPSAYPDPAAVVANGSIREFWGNTVVDDGSVPLLLPNTSMSDALIAGVSVADLSDRSAALEGQVSTLSESVGGLETGDDFRVATLAELTNPANPSGQVNATGVARYATVHDDNISSTNNGRYFQSPGTASWAKVAGDVTGRVANLEVTVTPLASHLDPEGIPLANVETMEVIEGVQVEYDGEIHDIAHCLTTANRAAMLVGWTPAGRQIPDPRPELTPLLEHLDPEGIPLANVATIEIVEGIQVSYKGETHDIVKGYFTEDKTALLVGWTATGRQIPDAMPELTPLLAYASPGGIPLTNVETMDLSGARVFYDGQWRDIAHGFATEDRAGLLIGWTPQGRQIPDPSPVGILYSSGTGLAYVTDSGTETITTDGAAYTDIHHVRDGLWQCRSDRDGPMAMLRVNVDEGRVISAIPNHLWHILRTGQSLAEGWNSTPAANTVSKWPGKSLMFNAGSQAGVDSYPLTGAELTSFVDLVESGRESPLSEMANQFLYRCDEVLGFVPTILQSNHAQGGGGWSAIKKGTQPYANGMTEVTRGHAIALSLGMTYEVPVICIDHGEADQDGNISAADYAARMQNLITDYSADIITITGQARPPVLIQSQCSSHTIVHETVPTVALGQLDVALSDPRIFLACPKYFMEYAEDGIHLTQMGSLRLGDYHAKCLEWVLLGGADPATMPLLYPLSAVQSAGEIRITFHVPAGPLVLDTTRILDPGNYGFELAGATITGVTIDGNDVVISKTGTATEWRYAYTGVLNAKAGPRTGARGCLRDSDPRLSRYFFSEPLYNWCVHYKGSL